MTWSRKKANRRVELIQLKHERDLTLHEEAELAGLTLDLREKAAPFYEAMNARAREVTSLVMKMSRARNRTKTR